MISGLIPLNKPPPKYVIVEGSYNSVKPVHPLKQEFPIDFNPSGKEIDLSFLHEENPPVVFVLGRRGGIVFSVVDEFSMDFFSE